MFCQFESDGIDGGNVCVTIGNGRDRIAMCTSDDAFFFGNGFFCGFSGYLFKDMKARL
jgi:hypothetical protein